MLKDRWEQTEAQKACAAIGMKRRSAQNREMQDSWKGESERDNKADGEVKSRFKRTWNPS